MQYLWILFAAVLMGYLLYSIARVRGANKWYWAKWGFLFGPFVLPFVYFSKKRPVEQNSSGEDAPPENKKVGRLSYFFWHALGVLVFVVVLFGVLFNTSLFVPYGVVGGSDLDEGTLEFLRNEGLIGKDETPVYFYSDGLFSVREEGNLFTDRAAVSYWWDSESDAVGYIIAPFCGISEIEAEYSTDTLAPSSIVLSAHDEYSFNLNVLNEGGMDRAFYSSLREKWLAAKESVDEGSCELQIRGVASPPPARGPEGPGY
jgi:hypothetical protein